MEPRKRNDLLDALKVVFAIGVVLAHYQFPGPFGDIIGSLGTMGVIVFFLIQGYSAYCASPEEAGKILRRLRRNSLLTSIGFLVFVVFALSEAAMTDQLVDFADKLTDCQTYLKMVLLMDFDVFRCSHFWFLIALLLNYPFLYLIERYPKCRKWFYFAIPLLVAVKMAVEMYESAAIPPDWFDWHASGIFLWGGLPFALLGNLMAKYATKIEKLNTYWLLAAFLVFLGAFWTTCCLSAGSVDISIIFRIPSAVSLFLLALRYRGRFRFRPFAWFGRYGSVYIYVYHHLFGYSLIDVGRYWIAYPKWVSDWIIPLVVLCLSLILALTIARIMNFVHKQRQFMDTKSL